MKEFMEKLALISLFLILFAGNCFAVDYSITFGWDRNAEPDLAGYKLYKSVTSGVYSENIANILADANVCTVNVEITTDIPKYYFVLTAYDRSGLESRYSNEVLFSPDTTAPNIPLNFNIKAINILIHLEEK
jgi:hypothetical protein